MVDEVLAGLCALRARDPSGLSQGLGPANARRCMDLATDAITAEGLQQVLQTPGQRAETVTLVAAAGVFTSPIEWAALFLAAGCTLRIKAPASAPALCLALAEDLAAQGLPLTADTDRDLGQPDAVVAFGSDASMAAIQAATPNSQHSLYGHRFSIAVVTGDPVQAAQGLARDAALYDGRGCMAPAAVFTTGDPDRLGAALCHAMAGAEHTLPRGSVDPHLGPEWRRRVGLARVLGTCLQGAQWAIPVLDGQHFVPVALPRMLPIHPVDSLTDIDRILLPWRHQLSSCGTDELTWAPQGIHRRCGLGQMQSPAFPRAHDGRSMLGGILG